MTDNRKPKTKSMRHVAQVVRFRMETAFVEFNCPEDVPAESKEQVARELAEDLPDKLWSTMSPWHEARHVPQVIKVVSSAEAKSVSDMSGGRVTMKQEANVAEDFNFIVLLGDMEHGEGQVLWQPWFRGDPPDLICSDIAADWIDELSGGAPDLQSRTLNEVISREMHKTPGTRTIKPSERAILKLGLPKSGAPDPFKEFADAKVVQPRIPGARSTPKKKIPARTTKPSRSKRKK
jgi:hypothetical protein